MVEDQVLDRAYAALADPDPPLAVADVAPGRCPHHRSGRPAADDFAGVSRHVGVLESAGLVQREVRGREHWLSLQPDGLTMAQQWIDEQTDFWSARADASVRTAAQEGKVRRMTEARSSASSASCPPRQRWCSTNGWTRSRWRSGCVPVQSRCVAVTVEPHVGGSVRFDVDNSGTSVLITGQFLAIDRPNLLRFTWSNSNWVDPTAVSVVNVAFEPVR